ncbi:MAG TPA: BON domain-containing protein [Acidimicrobiia bacterium]|nr:BON domain-containing protein [Acidimicrobiia bacterium]
MFLFRFVRRLLSRRLRMLVASSAGAAVSYFFDPQQGRRRRNVARDKIRSRMRRGIETAERRADDVAGRLEGVKYRITPRQGDGVEVSGPLLADKVRSEVLGDSPFRDFVINVDAVGHEVHLRGEIADPAVVRSLRERVEAMPEVERVDNLIHPPGTPAPNKADARLT